MQPWRLLLDLFHVQWMQTYSRNGFDGPCIACAATDPIVQRWPGCMAVTRTSSQLMKSITVPLAS
jgi:hypothetical protein